MAGIYLISPSNINDLNFFLFQLEEIFSLSHKPELFQLRLKDTTQNFIEEAILKINPLCRKYNIPLILNDDIPLALKHNIGVHVGKDDAKLEEIIHFKENSKNIIGISCYNSFERAGQFANYVDYVSFGAIFPSKTKPNAVFCPQEVILEFAEKYSTKIAIIGGINATNLPKIQEILPCVSYICAISEIWHS